MLTWLDLPCPACSAQRGEECYRSDRVWGKVQVEQHPERTLAVLRANISVTGGCPA